MGATVVSKTVDGQAVNCLKLENAWCVLPLSITGGWTILHLGVRMFTECGVNDARPPRLAVGLMSGVTNGPGAKVCSNFVGMRSASVWYFKNGTPDSMCPGGPEIVYRNSTNTTNTMTVARSQSFTTNYGSIHDYLDGQSITNLSPSWILRVERSLVGVKSPSLKLSTGMSSGSTTDSVTDAEFLAGLESPTLGQAATALGWTAASTAETSFNTAYDELTYGELNSVAVHVAQSSPPIYIYQIGVARIS